MLVPNSTLPLSTEDIGTFNSTGSILKHGDRYAVAVILLCIMCAGLFGNGLVITAVVLSKKLRSTAYVFVVALSFSDLFAMLNIPWLVVAVLSSNGWPLHDWICTLSAFGFIIFIGFSIWTMACIAINRLILFTLVREIYDKIFSFKMTTITIIIIAIFNICVASPPIFSDFGKLGYDERFSSCTWDKEHSSSELFELVVVILQYPIPLLICITSYGKLYVIIRKQTQTMLSAQASTQSTASQNMRKSLSRRQLAVTKSMFYILCTFVICTLPFAIVMVMKEPGRFGPYSGCILLLNSALDPLIYALKMPNFKTEIKHILCCRYTKEIRGVRNR